MRTSHKRTRMESDNAVRGHVRLGVSRSERGPTLLSRAKQDQKLRSLPLPATYNASAPRAKGSIQTARLRKGTVEGGGARSPSEVAAAQREKDVLSVRSRGTERAPAVALARRTQRLCKVHRITMQGAERVQRKVGVFSRPLAFTRKKGLGRSREERGKGGEGRPRLWRAKERTRRKNAHAPGQADGDKVARGGAGDRVDALQPRAQAPQQREQRLKLQASASPRFPTKAQHNKLPCDHVFDACGCLSLLPLSPSRSPPPYQWRACWPSRGAWPAT